MYFLVIFESHHGANESVAKYVKWRLKNVKVDIFNIKYGIPNWHLYDTFVIGSIVRNKKISPKLHRFCEEYKEYLSQKNLGLYTCFSKEGEEYEDYYNAFPEELRINATQSLLMSGSVLIDYMKPIHKYPIKLVTSVKGPPTYEELLDVQKFVRDLIFMDQFFL
jgi:menaquinone-dependent protoporphyrinogen IX oxidase